MSFPRCFVGEKMIFIPREFLLTMSENQFLIEKNLKNILINFWHTKIVILEIQL